MATATGTTIGALRVVIGADTTGFKRGMGEASKGLSDLRRLAVPTIAAIAAVGAAATAVAVSMYKMARSEMDVIDAQAKLARSMGGTVTGLRALNLAASDNGIDGMEGALNRLNRRLGATEFGAGPAAVSVKRLNLNIKELAEADIDEKAAIIADRIKASGVSAQEAARHLQNLGFEQRGVAELFLQGGDAIRSAREDLELYGLAVSEIDAARIEAANDAFSRLDLVVDGLKTRLAVELAPTLLEIAQRLANVAKMVAQYIGQLETANQKTTELGANKTIVDFARKTGLALAKLIDWVTMLRDALNAFEGYAKWWANKTLTSIAKPFETMVRLGARVNESMFADQVEFFDRLHANREKGWEQGKQGWNDFWGAITTGQGKAQAAFEAGWDAPVPNVGDGGSSSGDGTGGGGGGGDGKDDEKAAKEAEKRAEELQRLREHMERRLEVLREFTATETELEVHKHNQRLADLSELWEAGIIPTEAEMMELREDLEQQHQDRLTEISAKAEQERARNIERWAHFELQQRAAVVNAAVGLLDQFAGESKAAALASIALSKGLAIAQIIQNTAAAQMRAVAELGPIAGPPMAAKIGVMGAVQAGIVAATGLAQAASVSSRGTGGLQGGASGSVGGRSSAPSSGGMGSAGGGSGPRVNINLIEDRNRAGQVEVNRSDDEEVDADVFVADIRGGGPRAQALQETFNLRRAGS